MKVLFVMFRPKFVNTYEPALRLLAERGHRIHFAFSMGPSSSRRKRFDAEPMQLLARDFPDAVTWDEHAPERDERDGWSGIANGIRVLGDYWRYLHPRYADAPLLRRRVAGHARQYLERALPAPLARAAWAVVSAVSRRPRAGLSDALLRLSRDLERAVPPSRRIDDYLQDVAPDVVLVTPLVDVASDQPEFLKSAASLGIPSGICVNSWDNLTNKGVIRADADAVFVWNDAQRREAVTLHGVPEDRVVVTGAQKFDEWFRRSPTLDAGAFAAKVGLRSAAPYVLYVGSSRFIAADEVQFVRRWLDALRRSGDAWLRDVPVLVRPHPENGAMWRGVDLSGYGDVAVYPPEGDEVSSDEARADFFDSLYHSAAVVGINTSAMIEAAIVGKHVYSILADEFRDTQEGTLHFRYLLRENGGILRVAGSLDEHVRQLADGASSPGDALAFVESFVRPHGLDAAAAPIVADAIEALAQADARPPVVTARSATLRRALSVVAAAQRPTARRSAASAPGLADRVLGKQIELELSPLKRGRDRIVVGPWLGDPADELLYWIPYVRRLSQRLGLERDRLVAVSSGGVGAWYEDICGSYIDLGGLLGPEVLGRGLTGWVAERESARAAAFAALRSDEARSIAPGRMRRLFHGYRTGRAPLAVVEEFTAFRSLSVERRDERRVAIDASLGRVLDAVTVGDVPATDTVAVGSSSLLIAAHDGYLAPLGVFLDVPTIGVRAEGAELAEPDVDLLAHVSQQLGGTYTVVDRSELGFALGLTGLAAAPAA
jgi:hypothetical protein